MCAIVDCMMLPCVDSVRAPDQCCATCPNGKTNVYNLTIAEGNLYIICL